MYWLILTSLASLVLLESPAPSNGAIIHKQESGLKDFLSAIEENYLVATSRTNVNYMLSSSSNILTKKSPIINQNISVSNVSTQQTSQHQEGANKPEKEVAEDEQTTVKEDQETAEYIFSKFQGSQVDDTTETNLAKGFELVEESIPFKKKVVYTTRGKIITDYNFSSNHTTETESSERPSKEVVKYEKEKPTKREDTIPLKEEDAEIVHQTQSETPLQQQTVVNPSTQSSEKPEEASEKPSLSEETTVGGTTKRPKPSKPKPPRTTTLKPLAESPVPVTPTITVKPSVKPITSESQQRYPCRCASGTCSCCTGILLENFNVPLRSRACANVTYEPDDFAFNFKLAYNNIVLYNRRMSAKNPRPACIPINRYFGIKMCAKLSNVYMSGRNVHACLDFEGFFDDETAFKYSFNCFRIGSQGVAIVRPEDGGGLPPPPEEEDQTDEDYDDSARAWRSRQEVKKRQEWKNN